MLRIIPSPIRTISSRLLALATLLALHACGHGVSTTPRTGDPNGTPVDTSPRNLAYKLTLNDTGVTSYLNGLFASPPDTPMPFNTTQYGYYATRKVWVVINLHKDTTRTKITKNFNSTDPSTYDWRIAPHCLLGGEFIPCKIYDTNGGAHGMFLYFNYTATDPTTSKVTWTLRVQVDDIAANGSLGTELQFNADGRLISIGNTELTSTDDLHWLLTNPINTINMPAFNVDLDLSHRADADYALYLGSQDGCAASAVTTVDENCWKKASDYTFEGAVYDLRTTPPKTETASRIDYPGQDADVGLDKSAPNGATGNRGFRFEKLVEGTGKNGAIKYVDNSSADWNCVQDLVTGLYWEHKTGIRDDVRYGGSEFSWYDANPSTNGGEPGSLFTTFPGSDPHGCKLAKNVNCNTQEYIKEMNKRKLCGYDDWRLPTMLEVYTLIDFSIAVEKPFVAKQQYKTYQSALARNVMINHTYFPNLQTDDIWTSQTLPTDIKSARVLHLDLLQMSHEKSNHAHVLLVRGKSMQ